MEISNFNGTGADPGAGGGPGKVDPKDQQEFENAAGSGEPNPSVESMTPEEQMQKLTEMFFSSGRNMVMQLADDSLKSPTGGEDDE